MLRIGEVYRYARPYAPHPKSIGKYPNFFAATYLANQRLALVEKGINPIAAVKAPDKPRVPAILISSSPHKIGSKQTPWHDLFDTDNGHIRYFGDAKVPTDDPSISPGNAALLAAYKTHAAHEQAIRYHSIPLIFFERVRRENRAKGFLKFQGYGVIARAELLAQYDQALGRSFANYVYDFAVLDLAPEGEKFDWGWITDRRNRSLSVADTLSHSPKSWKDWLDQGHRALFRFTRRVAKQRTLPKIDQRPAVGSLEEQALQTIYKFYTGKNHRFELLAAEVAQKILSPRGSAYHSGWVTPPSGDGGADFVSRLDLGSGFATAKVVVLGQAKCESPQVATSGRDIARTVARLKRGWIGVYVTTSYFSELAQQEVIEDQYPIVLVHGRRLAEEVLRLANEHSHSTVQQYLEKLDSGYNDHVAQRRPEEILLL